MSDAMNACRGNVLFLILIAVALFAALSYAVTNSTRSGGGDTQKENAAILAAQHLQFFTGMHAALLRMMMNGCEITDLSFENPLLSPLYAGGGGARPACQVFNPAGGGMSYSKPTTAVNGGNDMAFYKNYGIFGIGANVSELVAIIPNIGDAECRAVNKSTSLGDTIPLHSAANTFFNKFTYGSTLDAGPGLIGDVATRCPECSNKPYFCVRYSSLTADGITYPDANTLIFALIER